MLESGIERVSYPSTTGQSVSTLTGIDVLESTDFAALKAFSTKLGRPLKLGLLTNQSGIDAHSIRTIDILFAAGNGPTKNSHSPPSSPPNTASPPSRIRST